VPLVRSPSSIAKLIWHTASPKWGIDDVTFVDKYLHRTVSGGVGHNLPQEAPQAFAEAVIEVDGFAS
jgi:hypothetical protein